jgi:hypothetical protein
MMSVEASEYVAALPPPRNSLPTLEFALDEYARQSCLPDADDDLVFEPTPALGAISTRVPFVVGPFDSSLTRTRDEALLLALVDGVSPVGLLVQLVDTDPDAAIITICELYARGLVDFY